MIFWRLKFQIKLQFTANISGYWDGNILRVCWWYINFSQDIIHHMCLVWKIFLITYAKVLYEYSDDIEGFFSIYKSVLIQYWEKTLNIIKVLIWYFSISNKISFFICTKHITWWMIFWEKFMYHQNTLQLSILGCLWWLSLYHHLA